MSAKSERKRMAPCSGHATTQRQATEEERTSSGESKEQAPKRVRFSQVEDRIDYRTVRHARVLATKRGEKSMAWEEFKKKL